MADIAHANRIEPLSGRVGGAAGVSLTPAGAAHRVSLRVDPAAAKTLSKKLGLELPVTPKTSVDNGKGRLAAWLGPDEWLIIDENADPLKDLAKVTTLHSAVDISHRNTAVLVSGRGRRQPCKAAVRRT
jgi:sarcosine oxidase subunit gamma